MARHVDDAPAQVLQTAKILLRRGLVEGTAGNVSARQADGSICVTPSSLSYEEMALGDLVVVSPDGDVVSGAREPSSELALHLACLSAFDDIAAVVHCHPVHASMFAVARQPVPACVDEVSMYVGGDVRCAGYAPSGSATLGEQAVEALRDRGAALLANHGLVTVGPAPVDALHIAALVERTAQIAWGARVLGGALPAPGAAGDELGERYREIRRRG